jgi:hypothetical protein
VLQAPRFRLHADAAYILRLQLEEADRIVLNKVDTLGTAERRDLLAYLAGEFPHAGVSAISALSGDGVAEWLDALDSGAPTGERIVAVDYDRYANGEAVLGWLNAVANLRWIGSLQPAWASFVRDFFARLQEELKQSESEIGHLKALLDCGHARIAANLTALDGDLHLREIGAADRLSAMLTVNARVQTSPADVESAFRRALAAAAHGRVAATVTACHCLKPGRPEPTYRYAEVVTRA